MDDLDRLLIERACERLVTAYCEHIDGGRAARVPELFTDDGRCIGAGMSMAGRAELELGFQAREAQPHVTSMHLCQNFRCDVVDEDHATGVTYFSLHRHEGELEQDVAPLRAPALIGKYCDRFERTKVGWRIADRRIDITFMSFME